MKKSIFFCALITSLCIASCKKDGDDNSVGPITDPISRLVGTYNYIYTKTTHRTGTRNGLPFDTTIVSVVNQGNGDLTKTSDTSFLLDGFVLFTLPPLKVLPGYLYDSSYMNRYIRVEYFDYKNPYIRRSTKHVELHEEQNFTGVDSITENVEGFRQ